MKYVLKGKAVIVDNENIEYTIIEKDNIEYIYSGYITNSQNIKPNAIIRPDPYQNNQVKYVYTKFDTDCLNNLPPCTADYTIRSNKVYKGSRPFEHIPTIYDLIRESNYTYVIKNGIIRYTIICE